MVPEQFADFSFRPGPAGQDDALCGRVLEQPGASERVVVIGATRVSLLTVLAGHVRQVDAFDPSRTQLRRARAALGDANERIGLFAEDLRDADVHDDPPVILVPSLTWRLLTLPQGRASFLRSMVGSLPAGGHLCMDVDRVPLEVTSTGPFRWTIDADRGVAVADGPDLPAGIELATLTPEETIEEVRAVGLTIVCAQDAATGDEFGPGSERLWLVTTPRA